MLENSLTVSERVRAELPRLAPAERRVALVLLGDDPLAGLEPVATLADRAEVSAPTVLRLLGKLGFASYPAFQQAVKDELSARLDSPAQMYPTGRTGPSLVPRMLEQVGRTVTASYAHLTADDAGAVVRLFASGRRPLWTVGGRFSGFLADYLAAHLQLLRPAVTPVSASPGARAAALLDIDARSVVVAFDYRRYQHDTIELGRAAAGQGATVVLFTDRYLSPLAADADVVLPTSVEAPSPFDVLTPAVALVEALVAAAVDRLADRPRARMTRYDELNTQVIGGDR